MVPDDANLSAFAVYSGKTKKSVSRNQKRRLKSKERRKNAMDVGGENVLRMKKKKSSHSLVSDGALASTKLKSELQSPPLRNIAAIDAQLSLKGKKNKKLKKKKMVEVVINSANKEENPKLCQNDNSVNNDREIGINGGLIRKEISEKEATVVPLLIESGNEKVSMQNKKPKKLKRKVSKKVTEEEIEKLIVLSDKDKDIFDKEPPMKMKKVLCTLSPAQNTGINVNTPVKIKKKVCITSPKEITGSDTKLKKPIVCTPRFVKKRKVVQDFVNDRKMLDINPNSTMHRVDEYLNDKKEFEFKLSKIGSVGSGKGHKPVQDIELAQLAKIEMQMKSSEVVGKYTFERMLEPISVDSFMSEHWEKLPLHIPGQDTKKFTKLISTERIDAVLRDRVVNFGKHLDVTSYSDGKRETHNLEGRAHAHVVWDFYSNGCSVRLLNPQYFFNSVHALNAVLQEYFGCFVGANSYLTPPMSQGFAPHYDDIEAFILQIEGSKIWRLYEPMDKNGFLPRYSSRNLLDEEIGEPVLEVKLNPGDVLYFPRGYIHQGRTEEQHSLHLTLSVYQKTAWCDLLEKLLPLTLKKAASQDLEFRKGLPIGYLKSAGLVHKNAPSRKEVVKKIKQLITRLNDFLETDSAIDQMGLSFVQDALPPVLTVSEAACSVAGDGWKMRANGQLHGQVIITPDTNIRWIRAFCHRILEEEVTLEDGTHEKQIRIYHTLENSREYHAEESQYLIIDTNMLPCLHHLSSVYPDFIKVSELPYDDEDGKILLVSDLWDRGLLMTDAPLEFFNGSKSESETEPTLNAEEREILCELEEKVPKDNEKDYSLTSSDSEGEELSDFESVEGSDVLNSTDEECFSREENI